MKEVELGPLGLFISGPACEWKKMAADIQQIDAVIKKILNNKMASILFVKF